MTRERLKEYRDLIDEIAEQESRLTELDARATKCTTRISDDPHVQSQIHDSMAEVVAQKVDTIIHINNLVIESYAQLAEIEAAIIRLPSMSRRILRLRYIDGRKWEAICCAICYGWSQTHELHVKALKDMETSDITGQSPVI